MEVVKRIENDVVIMSDDDNIINIASKVTQSLNLKLIHAKDTIDLYVIGGFCMIIDPEMVDSDYFQNFIEIHELENPKEFVVILTKPVKLPVKIKKYFLLADNNGKFEIQLRTTLLNRRSNIISRKTDKKQLTTKLNRLFAILRHLQVEGNYIKVDDLAKEFGVSTKTIKRDLTYLREVGGEDIQYDLNKKGYYLVDSYNSKIVARFDPDIH